MQRKWRSAMNEETYKTMRSVGAGNLVIGILAVVAGVAIGVLAIVNGGRLLRKKSDIMF